MPNGDLFHPLKRSHAAMEWHREHGAECGRVCRLHCAAICLRADCMLAAISPTVPPRLASLCSVVDCYFCSLGSACFQPSHASVQSPDRSLVRCCSLRIVTPTRQLLQSSSAQRTRERKQLSEERDGGSLASFVPFPSCRMVRAVRRSSARYGSIRRCRRERRSSQRTKSSPYSSARGTSMQRLECIERQRGAADAA